VVSKKLEPPRHEDTKKTNEWTAPLRRTSYLDEVLLFNYLILVPWCLCGDHFFSDLLQVNSYALGGHQ